MKEALVLSRKYLALLAVKENVVLSRKYLALLNKINLRKTIYRPKR